VSDLDLMACTARDLCNAYSVRGAYRDILDVTAKIIPLIEGSNRLSEGFGRPGSTYSVLCSFAGQAMGQLGQFEEGVALCERSRRYALGDSVAGTLAFCEMTLANIFLVKGDGETAVAHAQCALEASERSDATLLLGFIKAISGQGYLLMGDPKTGRVQAERALAEQSDAGIAYFLSFAQWVLASCYAALGDLEKALSHGEESLSLARLRHERQNEAAACAILGRMHALTGELNYRQGEELLQQAIAIFEELGTRPLSATTHFQLGQTNAQHGQMEKAKEHLKIADVMFREMGMDHWLMQSQEALAQIGS
jgi:tetratricopeptide (TPR) repeat protein